MSPERLLEWADRVRDAALGHAPPPLTRQERRTLIDHLVTVGARVRSRMCDEDLRDLANEYGVELVPAPEHGLIPSP